VKKLSPPYLYEEVELCPIATQIAYPNHTLTQTHHNLRKLIIINLQFFKMLHCFSINDNFSLPKTLMLSNIIPSLNLACNWHIDHQASSL
jgi:hypothetical protein